MFISQPHGTDQNITAIFQPASQIFLILPQICRYFPGFFQLSLGQHVNLERAMPANGRFGGHIVVGHVDGTGKITEIRRDDNAVWYTIQASPQIMKYIVTKGSVTVDGISLTVAKVSETDFSISAIPHTVKITVLGERKEGDIVNLETDIIGKYVEKLITPVKEQPIKSNITRDFLNKYGF